MPIDRPDGEQTARRYGDYTPPDLAIVGGPQYRFGQTAAIIVRRPDVRNGIIRDPYQSKLAKKPGPKVG